MPFGAEHREGATRFALWAPGCERVGLELGRDNPRRVPMLAEADGWHSVTLDVPPGEAYAFRVGDGLVVPDPASRANPWDVGGPSAVVDPAATIGEGCEVGVPGAGVAVEVLAGGELGGIDEQAGDDAVAGGAEMRVAPLAGEADRRLPTRGRDAEQAGILGPRVGGEMAAAAAASGTRARCIRSSTTSSRLPSSSRTRSSPTPRPRSRCSMTPAASLNCR
mgnify:CR=1 FL=1